MVQQQRALIDKLNEEHEKAFAEKTAEVEHLKKQIDALQYYMTSIFIEKAQQSEQLSSFSLIHGKHSG